MKDKKQTKEENLFDQIIKSAIGPNQFWSICLHEIKENETTQFNFKLPNSLSDLLKEYKAAHNDLYDINMDARKLIVKYLAKCEPMMRKEIELMKKDLQMLRETR